MIKCCFDRLFSKKVDNIYIYVFAPLFFKVDKIL